MRIAYIGNFRPNHSTENHVKASLESMGHEVLPLQEDNIFGFAASWFEKNQIELLLWTRTWPGLVDMKMIDGVKALGIPTVSYHLDLYVGIQREAFMEFDPFWRTDYVFTPDGDPDAEIVFKKKGINHFWLPPAVFKQETRAGIMRTEFMHDVVFVGSGVGYHPEWPYRVELLSFLRKTYGPRFKHYGWKGSPPIRGKDLNDLYRSAKVVVGDSLCKGFKHEGYWSDRVYETIGRGGFIIHPYIKGLETQFEIPKELVCYPYGDFATLKGLIDFYVKHDKPREIVAGRGRKRVRRDHTYENRMKSILEIVCA